MATDFVCCRIRQVVAPDAAGVVDDDVDGVDDDDANDSNQWRYH